MVIILGYFVTCIIIGIILFGWLKLLKLDDAFINLLRYLFLP